MKAVDKLPNVYKGLKVVIKPTRRAYAYGD